MCKLVEEYAQKRAKEYGEQQKAEGLKEGIKEGREEGRKEGRTEGFLAALVLLVKEKSLDPVDAARKANMNESEFMKLVQQS